MKIVIPDSGTDYEKRKKLKGHNKAIMRGKETPAKRAKKRRSDAPPKQDLPAKVFLGLNSASWGSDDLEGPQPINKTISTSSRWMRIEESNIKAHKVTLR